MKTAALLILVAALGIFWAVERFQTNLLRTQLAAVDDRPREIAGLQREQARLRALQQGEDKDALLRRIAAERARLHASAEPSHASSAAPEPLDEGEWKPVQDWKNCGQATPAATVETTLWAAAGGDVATFKRLIVLSDQTRAAADALLARLPPEARAQFASAEDLVASYSMARVPLGEAQAVWFNQSGPNDATVAVFLKNPATPTGAVDFTPATPASVDKRAPPQAPPDHETSTAYLALRRGANGWQLVVPPQAVDQIAKPLGSPATPSG